MSNSEETEDVEESKADAGAEAETEAIDPAEYTAFFDGDPAADRIPNGPASRLYADPDAAFDYQTGVGEATHLGDLEQTELRLESLSGDRVKRYLLSEPETDEEMDEIIRAVLQNNRFRFCAAIVSEPELTHAVWEDNHTPRERALLYDHSFAWMRMSDFVTVSETVGE